MPTSRVLILLGLALSTNAFTKYGRTCKDIGCLPSQVCVMTSDSCSYSQREGKECGTYPICARNTNGGGTSDVSESHSTDRNSQNFEPATSRPPSYGGSSNTGSSLYPSVNPQHPHTPSYPMNPSYPANPSYPNPQRPQTPSYPMNPSYPANPTYPVNPSYPNNIPGYNPSGGNSHGSSYGDDYNGGYKPSGGSTGGSSSSGSGFNGILSGLTKIFSGGGSSGGGGSGLSSILSSYGGGGNSGSGGGLSSILSSFGGSDRTRTGMSSDNGGNYGGSSSGSGGLSSILSSFGSDNRGCSGSSGTALLSGLSSLFSGGGNNGGIKRTRYGGLFSENSPSDSTSSSNSKVTGYPTQPPIRSSYPTQPPNYSYNPITSSTTSGRTNSADTKSVQYGWNVRK